MIGMDITHILGQFGEGGIGSILYFIFFMFFMLFYQKIIVYQMIWQLEKSAEMLERITVNGKKIVAKKISKRPDKKLKQSIDNFLEFFVIGPVDLDPYGIIKKIEHVVNLQEKRFEYFVNQITPGMDTETQKNVTMGLSAAISLNQISKVVRHYVEMIKKTKNLQIAMILQMQVPLIERIAKALFNGTEALTNGWPIGDSIGSLISAGMVGNARPQEIEEETLLATTKIGRRTVFILRARGPGGRLGKLGKATEKVVNRGKVAKIIAIDAAAKLEGEKTGSVAEGVGVALGGVGIDRAYIENIAVKKDIPLDSIVIKMSQEEAIQPMKADILASVGKVVKLVEENIARTKERGRIIVIGVGNSNGVGNDRSGAAETEKIVKKIMKKIKKREEERKRRLPKLIRI